MGNFPTQYSKWVKAVTAGMNAEVEFDCVLYNSAVRDSQIRAIRERAARIRAQGYEQGVRDEGSGLSIHDGVTQNIPVLEGGEVECWVRGYCQARSTRETGVLDYRHYMPF